MAVITTGGSAAGHDVFPTKMRVYGNYRTPTADVPGKRLPLVVASDISMSDYLG